MNLQYQAFRCHCLSIEVLVRLTRSGCQRYGRLEYGEYAVVKQARRKQEGFTSAVRVKPHARESGVINLHYCYPTVACTSVKLVEACSSFHARQADKSFNSDWLCTTLWSIQHQSRYLSYLPTQTYDR